MDIICQGQDNTYRRNASRGKRPCQTLQCFRYNHHPRLFLFILIGLLGVLILGFGSFSSSKQIEDDILQSFQLSDQEGKNLIQRYRLASLSSSSSEQQLTPTRRILLVGLVASLEEWYNNSVVVESMGQLCNIYNPSDDQTNNNSNNHEGSFVHLHVLYQHNGDDSDVDMAAKLKEQLQSAGCQTTFITETELWEYFISSNEKRKEFIVQFRQMSRYNKLAKLRSFQRKYITSSQQNFDIVINVDLDVVQFPPLPAIVRAIERITQQRTNSEDSVGSIVCANGYEHWKVGKSMWQKRLYYDTYASIDEEGQWYYSKYSTNLWQIITFGQSTLFRKILQNYPNIWPMQSCFGGLALYDFQTWSNALCDYDRTNIRLELRPPSSLSSTTTSLDSKMKTLWTMPPQYTRTGTSNGDACEHVVFQQCLRDAATQNNNQDNDIPTLEIGIQPDLLIGREAAILARKEDQIAFCKVMLSIASFVCFSAMIMSQIWKQRWYSPWISRGGRGGTFYAPKK